MIDHGEHSYRGHERLKGLTALVTDADSGLGRAVAIAFAREGARIAAFDIARPLSYPGYQMGSCDDLESLAATCQNLKADCLTLAGDVRDDASITRAVEATVERFGRIDVLFNISLRFGDHFIAVTFLDMKNAELRLCCSFNIYLENL